MDFIGEFANNSDKGSVLLGKLVVFRLRGGHFLKNLHGKVYFQD